jgi:hypothetical protein
MGRFDEAMTDIRRCLALYPKSVKAKTLMANIEKEMQAK